MNAPHAPFSFHAAPNTAPRVVLPETPDGPGWTPGFAGVEADASDPLTYPCDPTPLSHAHWVAISPGACSLIGLRSKDLVDSPEWLDVLSGRAASSHLQPYASVYAGHQFGVFVPRLGDGRALNIGARNGYELQLKGAGPTPYARFADGRAVLRSSIREFLCSEAMHALGIPTTRALSLVMSNDPVMRETVEQAAVVCRLSPSFVRFGTFEYFASRGRDDVLRTLVRHVRDLLIAQGAESLRIQGASSTDADLAIAVCREVAERTARLMAQWMGVGFMHGVMNTDNFSILGLTIDYGPFGFMDGFDAHHVCNHSDHSGRYRYAAQPQIGLWNVMRLATALQPLVNDVQRFEPVLEAYKSTYAASMTACLRAKFGLQGLEDDRWDGLLDDFYALMQAHSMDYTLTFRALCSGEDPPLLDQLADREAARPWLARYRQAAADSDAALGITEEQRLQSMRSVNPKYVLRNWVAEEVIQAVRDRGDTAPLEQVFRVLQSPYDEHPDAERYSAPPPDWAHHLTVSCSS